MWEGSLILEKKEPIEVFDALFNSELGRVSPSIIANHNYEVLK